MSLLLSVHHACLSTVSDWAFPVTATRHVIILMSSLQSTSKDLSQRNFLLVNFVQCLYSDVSVFWFMPCLKDLMCFEWLQVWVPFSLVGYLVSPSSMCSLSRNVCFLHSWRKKTKGSQLIQVIRQRPINWRWAHVAINFSRKQADLSSP